LAGVLTEMDDKKNEDMISFDEFKRLDLKVGKVLSAEKVEKADKLLRLEVDLGAEIRQIVAGLAEYYDPDSLIGKEVIVLTNLEPRTIRGIESRGMVLAADTDERPVLICPEDSVQIGCRIR